MCPTNAVFPPCGEGTQERGSDETCADKYTVPGAVPALLGTHRPSTPHPHGLARLESKAPAERLQLPPFPTTAELSPTRHRLVPSPPGCPVPCTCTTHSAPCPQLVSLRCEPKTNSAKKLESFLPCPQDGGEGQGRVGLVAISFRISSAAPKPPP